MPKIKVRFDEPEHGWIGFVLSRDDEPLFECVASHIYNSFDQLVTALATMLDERGERLVTWLEEPAELEMRFWRRDDALVHLEINSFPGDARPREKPQPQFAFVGSYDEICLPFWRALRSLEGRYSPEEWTRRSRFCFSWRELALLSQQLGKG